MNKAMLYRVLQDQIEIGLYMEVYYKLEFTAFQAHYQNPESVLGWTGKY